MAERGVLLFVQHTTSHDALQEVLIDCIWLATLCPSISSVI